TSLAPASSRSVALAAAKRRAIEPLTVPAGFTDTVFAQVPRPVAMDLTPDGRVLVVDQSGLIRVIQDGTLLSTPALDISAKLCSRGERGMLGIAVDPQFASNGYLYVYYTYTQDPTCTTHLTD